MEQDLTADTAGLKILCWGLNPTTKTCICMTEEEVYRAARPHQGPGDLHALGTKVPSGGEPQAQEENRPIRWGGAGGGGERGGRFQSTSSWGSGSPSLPRALLRDYNGRTGRDTVARSLVKTDGQPSSVSSLQNVALYQEVLRINTEAASLVFNSLRSRRRTETSPRPIPTPATLGGGGGAKGATGMQRAPRGGDRTVGQRGSHPPARLVCTAPRPLLPVPLVT